MGWRGLAVSVLAIAALAGCAATPAARNAAIIEKVAAGDGDPCDGEGWARARLLRDGEALTSLRRAVAARLDQEQGDAALPDSAARLAGLENTLRALTEMETRADWPVLRAGAQRWVNDARRRAEADAAAFAPGSFAAARARLASYAAATSSNHALGDEDFVGASLRSCLLSPLQRAARLAYGAALIDVIAARGWPQDAIDGAGAAVEALDVSPQNFRADDRASACRRVASAADAGRVHPGAWTYLRRRLACAEDALASPDAFMARFEADWPSLQAFLAALPVSSLGEDLRARVELEQYGRGSIMVFISEFGADALTEDRNRRIAEKIVAADQANTARLKEILVDRVWVDDRVDGRGAQRHAFLILQHADLDPAFQSTMITRLEPLLAFGQIAPDRFALLWDRVAVAEGRPQRFATQAECRDGQVVATGGVEDPQNLDQRRAAFDLLQTWDEYREMMRVLTGCRAAPVAAPVASQTGASGAASGSP